MEYINCVIMVRSGESRRLCLSPDERPSCPELHDMLGPEHEDAAHGPLRENVVGRTESIGHRNHKLAAHGARLATGATQEGTAQRVHDGQLYRGHNHTGFHKTR